ncbi:MAG: acetyl-CoA carboxylase biotin carboxyl carrier protein subunit [Oligoflexales bacterium]
MYWKVTTQDGEFSVELPDRIPSFQAFPCKINEETLNAVWNPRLDVLEINANGVPIQLSIKNFHTTRSSDEPTTDTYVYLNQTSVHRSVSCSSTVEPFVPGLENKKSRESQSAVTIKAPLTGTVIQVSAKANGKVQKGEVLLVIEAMKMENRVLAKIAGVVEEILVKVGDRVSAGAPLVKIKSVY